MLVLLNNVFLLKKKRFYNYVETFQCNSITRIMYNLEQKVRDKLTKVSKIGFFYGMFCS